MRRRNWRKRRRNEKEGAPVAIVWWILAVLALLVLAVCLLPVGARAVFTERSVTVTAFVGPIRFQV